MVLVPSAIATQWNQYSLPFVVATVPCALLALKPVTVPITVA